MICARCSKPLTRFAASIDSRMGPIGWGPKCARMALGRKKRKRRPAAPVVTRDCGQRDLFEELSA